MLSGWNSPPWRGWVGWGVGGEPSVCQTQEQPLGWRQTPQEAGAQPRGRSQVTVLELTSTAAATSPGSPSPASKPPVASPLRNCVPLKRLMSAKKAKIRLD